MICETDLNDVKSFRLEESTRKNIIDKIIQKDLNILETATSIFISNIDADFKNLSFPKDIPRYIKLAHQISDDIESAKPYVLTKKYSIQLKKLIDTFQNKYGLNIRLR